MGLPVNVEQLGYVLGRELGSFGVEVAVPAEDVGGGFEDVEDGVMCLAERVDGKQVFVGAVAGPQNADAPRPRPVVVVQAARHAAPGREHPRQDRQHLGSHRDNLGVQARAM